jgi:enterochelin esterase-like enzyme
MMSGVLALTSRVLEAVVIGCAVLCVALTVWLWPRLAHRGLRWVAARLTAVLLTQGLLVAALGLAANAYFEFYGTWADLLGTNEAGQVSIRQVSGDDAALTAALVRRDGSAAIRRFHDLPAGPPAAAGRLESVHLAGRRTGIDQQAYVYLPPQYFQPAFRTRRFPVVVAFTGYPGSTGSVVERLRLPQTADALERSGRMRPAVLVIVSQTVAPPRDTECVDVPDGPQAETYLTEDLPEAVHSAFRVGFGARSWGLLGYSAGGSCALELTMRHPRVFSAAVSMGGDYAVVPDRSTGRLFAGPVQREEHDLVWRLGHLPAPPVRVLVASSREGERDYRSTEAFLAAVHPPMSASTEILPAGGHNYGTWGRELPPALRWLVNGLAPA